MKRITYGGLSVAIVVVCIIVLISVATYFVEKPQPSAWQQSIEKRFAQKKSGQFKANDKAGIPIILEWIKTNPHEQVYAQAMQAVEDTVIRAFLPSDMQYLKENPNAVFTADKDHPYRKLEPLFKNDAASVDWTQVQKILESIAHTFWQDITRTNWHHGEDKRFSHSILLFVLAKDAATKKLLGFVIYHIDDDNPQGSVEFEPLAVAPEEQKRGLGKLLISSVFKLIPEVTWIVMGVNLSNEVAIKAYQSWGFAEIPGQKKDVHTRSIAMEYRAGKSDTLQKVAATLVDINGR